MQLTSTSFIDGQRIPGVFAPTPKGAFYLFFGIDGEPDTGRLGLRLVDEANIGLAPGDAFGPAGRGYLRFCFARSPESVAEAARRLVTWLEKR